MPRAYRLRVRASNVYTFSDRASESRNPTRPLPSKQEGGGGGAVTDDRPIIRLPATVNSLADLSRNTENRSAPQKVRIQGASQPMCRRQHGVYVAIPPAGAVTMDFPAPSPALLATLRRGGP
jgi:hypothetical protein